MHGCGDENQLVFKRAIHERIRAPIVAGGGFYESTEHAVWYDDNTATRVPSDKIVEMHNIFFMASRYMAAVASQSDDGAANMQTIFNYGVSYVCDHLQNRVLTASELAILKKICARSVGYCSPMSAMALMQASAGMEPTSADAHIGVVHEEDDPPFPGEVPLMHLAAIRQQAARLSKSVASTQRLPKSMIASRKGGSGDRIVLDGYTPFLIDRLKDGVDVRLNQSVCGVSRAVKAPLDPSLQFPQEPDPRLRATRAGQRNRSDALQFSNWHSDPEAASRTILVSTRSGEVYQADFVLITLPLGVLKSEHEESSISFSPPLSEEKQEAIRGMGMGVHNKIVLRFKEDEVFWPSKVPQLNCLDPRFQFFNLHCYGKTGVLLVHVFAESGFANRFWGLTDEAVVAEVLMVLGGMFCDQETPFDSATIRTTSKTPDGRRRVAALLNICENCRRPLQPGPFGHFSGRDNGDVACKACGFVAQKLEEKPGEEGDQQSRSLDKADGKQQNQPVLLTNEEEEVIPSSRKFTWYDFPAPEEYIVTRWEDDPFALGSYSYMPCGSSWTMIEQMAAPEPRDSEHPYLFFAGEHCSDLGWQCVHGAHETGIRAAREILGCLQGGPLLENTEDAVRALQRAPTPRSVKHSSQPDSFWTSERERALTRALIGYSDVYGNFSDVMDEMAHALQTFKKEPTDLTREKIRDLILQRIHERAQDDNVESKAFLRFHTGEGVARDEVFPKPFQEVHKRPRLIGLNGSKLKEKYSPDIIRELKSYASAVSQNQISYRETLRKIAVMVYKKDGGLMTKRCLPEYLRTQEFGTGPQKELFLEKYLSPKGQ